MSKLLLAIVVASVAPSTAIVISQATLMSRLTP